METSYSLSSGVLSTAGPTDNFVVDVYAGDETTLCGTVFTAGPYGSATNIGVTAPGGTSAAPALTSVSAVPGLSDHDYIKKNWSGVRLLPARAKQLRD